MSAHNLKPARLTNVRYVLHSAETCFINFMDYHVKTMSVFSGNRLTDHFKRRLFALFNSGPSCQLHYYYMSR